MRATHQIVEEQCKKWHIIHTKKLQAKEIPIITISREPGSGGRQVAEKIAQFMGFDLFHQEIIYKMAELANVSVRLLESLDEKGLNVLEDWVASFYEKHLWQDQYHKHLAKVVTTINKQGRAIIVGRGAGFILPADSRFRVRLVAPMKLRIHIISRTYGISKIEAKQNILRAESERRAFIKKYFYADISDPKNYDLVINMENLTVDAAANIIKCTLECR